MTNIIGIRGTSKAISTSST